MVVSCWNKNERIFSSFIYGLIALNVFEILSNSLNGQSNMKKFVKFKEIKNLTLKLELSIKLNLT